MEEVRVGDQDLAVGQVADQVWDQGLADPVAREQAAVYQRPERGLELATMAARLSFQE